MKKISTIFKRISDWYKWNISSKSVATVEDIRKHFELSKGESEMLDNCIHHHLIKESVVLSEDKSLAYVVVHVRECMTLVLKRRKNIN